MREWVEEKARGSGVMSTVKVNGDVHLAFDMR
jgi:hypothetical protein